MRSHRVSIALLAPCLVLPAACNSGSGSSSNSPTTGPTGALLEKPNEPGSFFINESHQNGRATRIHLEEIVWGRLVDVHGLRPDGSVDTNAVLQDFVIAPELLGNGVDYTIEENPHTGLSKLVIQRELGAPDTGAGTFEDLLQEAVRNVGPIHELGLGGKPGSPASYVARNAVLALRFDDLLRDDVVSTRDLSQYVRTVTGYPAATPFEGRLLFDPNHGGITGGEFHSTRILIDLTISAIEAAKHPTALATNRLGLPPSLIGTSGPNVALRIPTRPDVSAGQFEVLRNLTGSPLATTANGPIDLNASTLDLVRAMRSGNREDVSRGYLFDNVRPELVSNWPLTITGSSPDLFGEPELDFILDILFTTACRRAPRVGDVLRINTRILQVTAPASPPNPGGAVSGLTVRVVDGNGVQNAGSLIGLGNYQTALAIGGPLTPSCWVRFDPPALTPPNFEVAPDARVVLNFNEPMDAESLLPFDSMQVFRGSAQESPNSSNTVVGAIVPSSSSMSHTFAPLVPFDHVQGASEVFTVQLSGVTDLGGNALNVPLPPIEFNLDQAALSRGTGGIVLRFASTNEYELNDPSPNGNDDLRGQANYDLSRERLTPRPVVRESWPMDQTQPVGSLMALATTNAPLSPMGSRLMTIWRNADLGWLVTDESKDNMDVEGMSWVPASGSVNSDFFEEFEIRLAHSNRLPDEAVDSTGAPAYPASGLLDAPSAFDDNVLADLASPKTVVHHRSFGYRIDPGQSFVAATGTTMMPFPLNTGSAPRRTFTWRNMAVQAVGGSSSAGVPQAVEIEAGMYPGLAAGDLYPAGAVPSHGLPLLMEIACYPTSGGVGANQMDIGFRLNQFPSLRVHSTGGVNTAGQSITRNPDNQAVPSGGFSPNSTPPGLPTQGANPPIYFGQLDTVVRVSRAYSVWFDAQNANPDWRGFLAEPAASSQPDGTSVSFDFRGATSFTTLAGQQFDATLLNSYGDLPTGRVNFLGADASWKSQLDQLDGARYIQVRITFNNNIETGLTPTLDSFAISFEKR